MLQQHEAELRRPPLRAALTRARKTPLASDLGPELRVPLDAEEVSTLRVLDRLHEPGG